MKNYLEELIKIIDKTNEYYNSEITYFDLERANKIRAETRMNELKFLRTNHKN